MSRQIQSVVVSQCAAFIAALASPLKEQDGVINETSFRSSVKHAVVLL